MWLSIPEPTVSAMRFSLVHIVFGPSIYCLLGFIHALSGPCKLCFWALSTLPLGLVYTVSWFCPHCFSTLSKGYLALSKLSLSIFPNFFESWSQCVKPCPFSFFWLWVWSLGFPPLNICLVSERCHYYLLKKAGPDDSKYCCLIYLN